jgi:pre-mRNA branch site protein p14
VSQALPSIARLHPTRSARHSPATHLSGPAPPVSRFSWLTTVTMDRALFVKNLSYNVTPEELFDLFGKYGPIRQVRQGIATNTKGTAFVVYEDVMDAKQACDKLNGFNFQNRYLVVLYHQPDKMAKAKEDLEARKENLERIKKQHGID